VNIILAHDYLFWNGGAERCLAELLHLFPGAALYTLFHDRKRLPRFTRFNPVTTFLDHMPFLHTHHVQYLPLYPPAVDSMRIPPCELVVTSSWGWTKNIAAPQGSCHICYCYTPLRFAYDLMEESLERSPPVIRGVLSMLIEHIRDWDRVHTGSVNHFVAISAHVQERIWRAYRRESVVIYPPVDTDFFSPSQGEAPREDFYLMTTRLVPYKKTEIAIKAFSNSGKRLIVAGEGQEMKRLQALASPNIVLAGHVDDDRLRSLYRKGRAFIMPQEEDFGISALEAQACGMPVLAYRRGGALETVIEGVTGCLFDHQTPESLLEGINRVEAQHFDERALRAQALRFSTERFRREFRDFSLRFRPSLP